MVSSETEFDIAQAKESSMETTADDYSVDTAIVDTAVGKETKWTNTNASKYLGYYKQIPELKKAIDAFANYIVGKGYTADLRTTTILDNIIGWGEDTFNSICWNLMVNKKIYGDAFAEIIRNKKATLVNLKVLNPANMTIVVGPKGNLKRYEYRNANGKTVNFKPQEILHLCNDRVVDEVHGVSVIEACEWVILARNEAMDNWKTVLHRNINPLKIVELDTDDATKINAFITKWEDTVKDKETLFIPKGTVNVAIPPVALQDPLPWIAYLENFFYQAVGIPKVILGGTSGETEASAKISFTTYDQTYLREQVEFEADLWNQLAIRIKVNKPASLMDQLQKDETKDMGGFMPSDVMAAKEG